jgi:outer membrane protein OmpA-like peptidoglycan-associated protein
MVKDMANTYLNEEQSKKILNKTLHLYNGIDFKKIESNKVVPQNKKYKLLFPNRLQTFKNPMFMIESLVKLREKRPVMLPPAPVVADDDGDGVVGSEDDCPNASGLSKYHGCPVPDTDNDGINDENDKCPTAEGLVKYKGCPIPDADKDGINDEADKCPTAKGLSRYEGCPIPDTDKDGVNDEEDKCPSIPGIMGNNGCADLQPLVNEITSKLKFESGKVKLSKNGYQGLDSLVVLMQNNANMTLVISGHTDNIGTLKINEKLSLQRAMVVSNYLIKKGIDKKRVSHHLYRWKWHTFV